MSNKGSAFVLVLIVMVVLSILGATLLTISVHETKFTAVNEKQMKAYYLARSGALAVADWMLNPFNGIDREGPIGKSSTNVTINSQPENLDVSVTRDSVNKTLVKITSTAKVDGHNGKAILTLLEYDIFSESNIYKNTIYAANTLFMNGTIDITGTVQAGVELEGKGGASYTALPNKVIDLPAIALPEQIGNIINITLSGNGEEIIAGVTDIDKAWYYDKITGNGTLVLSTSSLLNVVVDELTNLKKVKLTGTGKVNLYVQKHLDAVEFENSDAKNLQVYLMPGAEFIIKGDNSDKENPPNFKGLIYGPGAYVKINGTPEVYGAIIANEVDVVGTSNITYDSGGGSGIPPESLAIEQFSVGTWLNP